MSNITAAMVKDLREMTGSAMMDCKKALVECTGDMEAAKEFLRKKGQATAVKKSSRETKEGAISIFANENNTQTALVKVACETDFVAINDKFKKFIGEVAGQVSAVGADNFMELETSNGSVKAMFESAISELGENIVFLEGYKWDTDKGVIGAYTHSNGKIGVLVELQTEGSVDQTKLAVLAKDVAMHIAASHVEAVRAEELDPAVLEKEKNFLIEQAKESGKPVEIAEKMVVGRMKKFKKEICLMDQAFVKDPSRSIEQLLKDSSKELGGELSISRFLKSQF